MLGLKDVVQRLKDEKEMRRLSGNREAVLKAARQRKNEILIERELKKREKEALYKHSPICVRSAPLSLHCSRSGRSWHAVSTAL